MSHFLLALTDAEKNFSKELIRWTIAAQLGVAGQRPVLESQTLRKELGAFVTLKKNGRLRGCIGNIVGNAPLVETLERMAQAAAFEDPRFPAVTREELDRLEIEVSVLGALTRCPDPKAIEVGRHGLYIRKGGYSGILLPQVAVEWKWNRETFLDQTCIKAGLPPGTWREPGVDLWWFEAVIF